MPVLLATILMTQFLVSAMWMLPDASTVTEVGSDISDDVARPPSPLNPPPLLLVPVLPATVVIFASEVGLSVGFNVGLFVGSDVGPAVGLFVGSDVGSTVGLFVGSDVDSTVGLSEGDDVNLSVGDVVGLIVGEDVGGFKYTIRIRLLPASAM
jgi:hypothetical protein